MISLLFNHWVTLEVQMPLPAQHLAPLNLLHIFVKVLLVSFCVSWLDQSISCHTHHVSTSSTHGNHQNQQLSQNIQFQLIQPASMFD
jgi:hypothetical protein